MMRSSTGWIVTERGMSRAARGKSGHGVTLRAEWWVGHVPLVSERCVSIWAPLSAICLLAKASRKIQLPMKINHLSIKYEPAAIL